ncbi:MAG: hypothetical protein ACLPZM_00670 [Thermoplasmata archaeon]
MRTGLVVIGLALAIVGAGVTLSGFLAPVGTDSMHARLNSISAPNIQFNETRLPVIWMTNTSSGSLELSWSATYNLAVSVYQAVRCSTGSGFCTSGAAFVTWSSNTSGTWNRTGALSFPYLLSIHNSAQTIATLRATLAESFTVGPSSLPTWAMIIILAGGVTLVAIGALAVFLGLFLRPGVYSGPEPITPRYAHELNRPVDPLDEPFDEEDLPPVDVDDPPSGH